MSNYYFALLAIHIALISFDVAEPALQPSEAVSYLLRYGHAPEVDTKIGNLMSSEALADSVRSFQRFAGLPMTGRLDRETLEKMSSKRCGNPDISGTENAKRKKRYAIQGSKWQKNHLTYKILQYTSDLSPSDVNREVEEAFKWWADQSGLTFSRVERNVQSDIEIKFASGDHGDGDPFDGEGQTLAHAYFPGYGGNAHFDEAERWVLPGVRSGVNLRIVAAHEFGHSLGLSHSDVQDALMAPFYNPSSDGLHRDDVQAIQHLYGEPFVKPGVIPTRTTTTTRKPVSTKPPRRTTTTLTPPVGACNGRFDAMTRLRNGSTYAFLGGEFWRLNNKGADEGYPQSVERVWGIRGKVDAALTYSSYSDIFQGKHVYRFYGDRLVSGYPLPIPSVYSGVPSHIDAAFQWSGNGKLYFMKGERYWRYNPSTRETDPGYPRSISVWRGLPNKVDASLQWNGKTYFFSDGVYYRFDDERIQVAQSLKNPYPRRSDEWWLGCKDNTLLQRGENSDKTKDADTEESTDDGGNGGSNVTTSKFLLFTLSTFVMSLWSSILA